MDIDYVLKQAQGTASEGKEETEPGTEGDPTGDNLVDDGDEGMTTSAPLAKSTCTRCSNASPTTMVAVSSTVSANSATTQTTSTTVPSATTTRSASVEQSSASTYLRIDVYATGLALISLIFGFLA